MNRKGFSLIELLIVIAIIAILTGIAVPYYNDYIVDSRTAVLQNNLATIRKALNHFRGDNQRGPIMVKVKIPGAADPFDFKTNPFEELVNGPLQNINGTWVRRVNVKYLESMPKLIDPATGVEIDYSELILATGSCYFDDADTNDIFDIENESAFIDSLGDGTHHSFDVNPFNYVPWTGAHKKHLDFIDISLPIAD